MAEPTTNITPPRVPFLDARNGQVSREWYRFFLNLFTNTGGGTGVTPIANGGTNSTSTPRAGAVAYGDGQSYRFTTTGETGQFLTSNGAGAPTWTNISGAAGSVAYGTGAAYSFSTVGEPGDVLVSGGENAPTWTSSPTFTQVTTPVIVSGAEGSGTSLVLRSMQSTPGYVNTFTINSNGCFILSGAPVLNGRTGTSGIAINSFTIGKTYNDSESPAFAVNAEINGNLYGTSTVTATNVSVTYDRSISFHVLGVIYPGTNVTINNQLAFQSDEGDCEFSLTLWVAAGYSASGVVGVKCTQGVLGYSTNISGSSNPGGSVTQATNKSTAVTLDAACGVITMNAAALAGGASVSFILNNALLAATDTLIVNIGPAGTADTYSCTAQVTGAGTASIRVTNYSGTSRSEAVLINFAIISATS